MADAPDSGDELYGLPLDEFTAARNALAKRLRAGGSKAAAAVVQKLRKPTVTAWALNQLARRQPEQIAGLLDAGAALRTAHRRALGGDASSLRQATRDSQQHVGDLAAQAATILEEAGSSGAANLDRLTESLRAALMDPAAGDQLRAGRLVADLESSGFGLDEASTDGVVETAPDGHAGGDGTDEQGARDRAAAMQAERTARRAAERLEREAGELRERAERLDHEAEDAERRAGDARARAEQAAAELATTERDLAAATEALEAATRALD